MTTWRYEISLLVMKRYFTRLLRSLAGLQNLLLLLLLRYLLTCFSYCNKIFLLLLRFLRNLRTSSRPCLPLQD